LTIPEVVSELLFGEKSLAEIAGYDDRQLHYVVSRPRDKQGRLYRRGGDLPEGVETDAQGMRIVREPVAFAQMFREVQEYQGVPEPEQAARWQTYREANPGLYSGGT
jgi:hypothetical protein